MNYNIPTDKKKCTIFINIKTERPQRIRVFARDRDKKNTLYYNRSFIVEKEKTIELPMPISPNTLGIFIGSLNGNDRSFTASVKPEFRLQTYKLFLNRGQRRFVEFAQEFCERAGTLALGDYTSNDEKYKIRFVDRIRDRKTGRALSTPFRIGSESGIIEVSKSDINNMTVSGRMILSLHEYAHVYINQKKESEEDADKNAWMIYMAQGYSVIEGLRTWAQVFGNRDTEQNRGRFERMKKYIADFQAGKIADKNIY